MAKSTLAYARPFFKARGWQIKDYQKQAWQAYDRGESGLISLPTGAGKTYSAIFGPLARLEREPKKSGLKVLYITPLKALARDIGKAIWEAAAISTEPAEIDLRTGDTNSYRRGKQRQKLSDILITTPESLGILVSYENAAELLGGCHTVVVDEWHELYGSKRGALLELLLTRLTAMNPRLQIWGLSATFGDLELVGRSLIGVDRPLSVIKSQRQRQTELATLIPKDLKNLPSCGHAGLRMMSTFAEDFDWELPSLVFTNTRSFAERWHQKLLETFPERTEQIGLHHGSIDQVNRVTIEDGLKSGQLKLVVCTASLDLGLDFSPIERIYQIGSPKSISRLLQRAGRSAHQPGRSSVIRFVPTHRFEIFEIIAVQRALERGELENPPAMQGFLDLLIQHIITVGIGTGFEADALYREVCSCYGLRELSRSDFDWCLEFAASGGHALKAYPQYHRLSCNADGWFGEASPRLSKIHRMNIGTITGQGTLAVKFSSGKRIGVVEERYLARLKPGDTFLFAGKSLEFRKIYNGACIVARSKKSSRHTPRWLGGQATLSRPLARGLREVIENISELKIQKNLKPIVLLMTTQQCQHSQLPRNNKLLIETVKTREGYHCFAYTFEGLYLNQAIGLLLALELSRGEAFHIQVTVNEYGFELLSPKPIDYQQAITPTSFSPDNLEDRLIQTVNLSELSQQQFKVIARIVGLVVQNYPGNQKSGRQIQSGSQLLYQVLERFDPDNKLLLLAREEVLSHQFELSSLASALRRLASSAIDYVPIATLTPFALPLWAERAATRFDSEVLRERIALLEDLW